MLAWRCEQRAARIAQRMALPLETHQALSKAVLDRLAAAFGPLWGGRVGLYWPCRREISTFPLARRILEAGGTVALPVQLEPSRPLQFRAWTPGDPLATGPEGACYPRDGHLVQPDVLLVALVAFDGANHRLGYGDGGYDRTLARTPRPVSIGLGFEAMRVETIHPLPHDLPMDLVVTEAGVFQRGCALGPDER